MRMAKLFPLLVIIFLLQSCMSPTPLEQSAIINTRGVDLIEENGKQKIETTIVPYIFDPEAQESTSILIGRGDTIKQAREDAGKQSSHLLSPGKINLEIYGKEAAEDGILPLLNTLIRDARVSERMQLAVTNQTARELLEQEQKQITINKVEFLRDLIDKEIKQYTLPQSTLQHFTRYVEQTGIDPILPVIDIVEDRPTLVGAALFQDDRYVEGISLTEAFMINQMRRRVKETPLFAEILPENYQEGGRTNNNEESMHVSLHLTRGKGKIQIIDEDMLMFKAKITMKVELLETSIPIDVKTENISNRMEKDLEAYFKGEYEKLFTKLKEAKSDAFGLGRKYLATRKGSKTTDKEWDAKYQDATMEFEVDLTLINSGTID